MSADPPVVVATYSRRMRLRLPDGSEVDARIRGRRLKPVCGDRVAAEPIEREQDWLITGILERDNALTRPDLRGRHEVLAANVDLIVAVAAFTPPPDWFLVDRYLCAAENMGADAAVVLNKIDIDALAGSPHESVLADYESLGYTVMPLSAATGQNIDQLSTLFESRTAIIVGQSGVGKSSISNRITGTNRLATGSLSTKKGGTGRHTTVNSVMLALPGGGQVIDSPGVRDFAPALESPEQVARGYREIDARRDGCRFANCRHLQEPGCAILAAVEDGEISARRYESFTRLLALTERLSASR